MATVQIESTAISSSAEEYSAFALAVEAGTACIANSGIDISDIDLLINISMYRDQNIVEPAFACLIQKGLGLNNDPLQNGMQKTTFSFDLTNGTLSFLNTIQIMDSMIKTAESSNALIVSCDGHPSQAKHMNFPFNSIGAAALLTRDRDITTRPQFFYDSSNNGYIGLKSHTKLQPDAQKDLEFQFEDDYVEQMRTFAIDSIRKGIKEKKIDLSDVEVVVAVQPEKEFGQSIAEGIGLSPEIVIDTFDEYGDTYSSDLILGYHKGIEQGRIKKRNTTLLVAVGSGLSFGCCVL